MKVDGSVIIDTKIIDGGMEKGFEAIKNEMNTVGLTAEKVGEKIQLAFSGKVNAPIENAIAKVQQLEEKLSVATEGFYNATYNDDDKGAENWAAKREIAYNQLEAARRRLAQVIVLQANKEMAAETAAARKAAAEKERQYMRATKSARAFGKRLTGVMSSALLFSVIARGLRKVTEYFGKALKTNQKFNETASNLKGALLTAFQPLYETLLPGIISAMQVITKFALVIGNFFASITGKNANQVKKNAEALYEQANATEENGKAAKKAAKALAGFDEINTLQNKNTEETGATSNPNFNLDAINLDSKLGELVTYTSAAILAIGLMLALSGVNIPLGISMIAIGAIGMYESIKENWGAVKNNVLSTSDAIAFLGGTLLLAIGIIITYCCPTHLALGIGMIIGGAALIASSVALNWNAIKEALQNPIVATVSLIAGAVLVVLGIMCCFAQVWGLGIGLIVAGAAFIVTTVAVNWNAIKEALQGPIGKVVAAVSVALLAIGAIIAFSGVGLALGISLMAAGAVGLATVVALNWNAIEDALQGPLGKVVALVSGALLALGVILLCCGIITPLTIGMVVAGAAGLATAIAFNWSAIVDWVKNVWNKVKEFWNKNIAQVFTGKFWLDLAEKCGNGLISGFENAVNGILGLFEKMINWIIGGLNKISFDVPDWVPGIGDKKFGFNIPEAKFGRVSIPRLAQGDVIPPNAPFMAVLGDQKHGTNIEAPLDTIKQAMAEVLAMQGGGGETNVNVTFTGDLAQLARILKPAIETETRRKGGSLAKGAAF